MPTFTQVELITDTDGKARFIERQLLLDQGSDKARLSQILPVEGLQLRHSPVGFRSDFHCTTAPQWVFILSGLMDIGLQDGTVRRFAPGMHFLSADTLPADAVFDASLHGHWSCQAGDEPLVTLFVKVPISSFASVAQLHIKIS